METGTENEAPSELDQIHTDAIAAASGENASVEKDGVDAGGSIAGDDSDALRVKGTIASCANIVNRTIYKKFYADLEPIAGAARAARIAEKASLDGELQKMFVDSGYEVAKKHGFAKFLSPEWALAACLVGWANGILSARDDMQELLKVARGNASPAPSPAQQQSDVSRRTIPDPVRNNAGSVSL